MAYLAGICTYGSRCHDQHPSDPEEVQRLINSYPLTLPSMPASMSHTTFEFNRFRTRACRYGAACQTEGCLYAHPTVVRTLPMPKPAMSAAASEFRPGSSTPHQLNSTPAPSKQPPIQRPVKQPTATVPPPPTPVYYSSSATSSRSAATPQSERIPASLWRMDVSRDASAFDIPDPIERFEVRIVWATTLPSISHISAWM